MENDKAVQSGIRSVGPLSFNLCNNAGNYVFNKSWQYAPLCLLKKKNQLSFVYNFYQGLAFGDVNVFRRCLELEKLGS